MLENSNPGEESAGATEENRQPTDQDEHDSADVTAGSIDGGSVAPLLELLSIGADEHVSVCWQRPERKFMAQLTTGGDAARVAAEHVDDANVWFGVNPIGKHVCSGRGGADDVTRCVALWADLDVGKGGACVDADQAAVIVKEISDKLGTNPVALVGSGSGGLHPYWPLDGADPAWRFKLNPEEPLKDNAARERAQKVLRRFQWLVDKVAAGHGVKVDNVSDMSRVLRWPGSYNRKRPDQPGLVELVASPLGASEPLTLEWVERALADAGIPTEDPKSKPEDGDKARVPSTAGDWRFGLITYPYVRAMIGAWKTDEVVGGRHPWMLSCFVRLACAHRCGRITETDYAATIKAVFDRFTLDNLGRELRPDEVTDTLRDAVRIAADKDDVETLAECGGPDEAERTDADHWTEDDADRQQTGGEVSDEYAALVARKMHDQRVVRDARRMLDEEDAARDLTARQADFRSKILGVRELDSIPSKPPLIDGVLPRDSYGIVRGRDASFKSFITLDWAMSLATGRPWQGKKVDQVKVLYVAAEGYSGLILRRDAWETHHGLKACDSWLKILPEPVNLYRDKAGVAALVEYIQEEGFGLVVFDTLRRCSGGADGNGSDMGVVVDAMQEVRLATDGGTVLAVAHTGKSDDDTRGFSGIEDDADFVHSVKRDGTRLVTTLQVEKMKDGPDGHKFDLSLMRVTTGEETSLVVQPPGGGTSSIFDDIEINENDQVFMATMLEHFRHTGTTMPKLIELSGIPKTTAYEVKKRLTEQGFLEIQDKRGQSAFFVNDNHRRVVDHDAEQAKKAAE